MDQREVGRKYDDMVAKDSEGIVMRGKVVASRVVLALSGVGEAALAVWAFTHDRPVLVVFCAAMVAGVMRLRLLNLSWPGLLRKMRMCCQGSFSNTFSRR